MTKKRISIPKTVAEEVLKEYRHKCAMCGRHEPQLHHIDEDPGNNDPVNLIPLCPNCHLQDIHAPTAPLDRQKVHLFRRSKDPFILDPRFHPVWVRLRFLRRSDGESGYSWKFCCQDLKSFVKAFQMGEYYSGRIDSVLRSPLDHMIAFLRDQGRMVSKADIQNDPGRHKEVEEFRATAIEDLCVEMIRYQSWSRIAPAAA